jgi:tRNA-splicing ligase RtcB
MLPARNPCQLAMFPIAAAPRCRSRASPLREQTEGVECRKDHGVIDEAYENIDKVMEQQRDLVEVVAELKQVLCVKG